MSCYDYVISSVTNFLTVFGWNWFSVEGPKSLRIHQNYLKFACRRWASHI